MGDKWNATPINQTWGSENIVNNKSINLLNASVEAWKGVGAGTMAQDFMFGFIPIIILSTMYIRTRRLGMSLIVGLLSTYALSAFNLFSSRAISFMLYAMVIGLGILLASLLSRKKVTYS